MTIDANTNLKKILDAYPGLDKKLIAYDSKFSILNTALGKMLVKRSTVKDVSLRTGIPVEELLEGLERIIQTL